MILESFTLKVEPFGKNDWNVFRVVARRKTKVGHIQRYKVGTKTLFRVWNELNQLMSKNCFTRDEALKKIHDRQKLRRH